MPDAQTVGAAAIILIAATGIVIPEIPYEVVMFAAAATGSIQAAAARMKNGNIKTHGAMFWAFIAGLTSGLLIGRAIAEIAGLTSHTSELLPIYILSLSGGRIVLWFVVGFDVEKLGDWILSKITKQ